MAPRNREPTRAQLSNGLEYVAQKPSFLANFGKPPPSALAGREPIPTRPDEGEWAGGSDDEDEDEWDKRFGGGEDGPQVVVLKEGRHLSADEVARERRRAKGEPSPTPEESKPTSSTASTKTGSDSKPGPITMQHKKRKLVGEAVDHVDDKAPGGEGDKDKKKKKKKKANKAMLSFNEAEGEE